MIAGRFYICPTPIGNLEDITLRVLKILREADLIACEDTRRTGKLLQHYEIDTPLISYHEHNEVKRTDELLDKLGQGRDIALVSDAGTPGISDPGEVVIQAALEAGAEVIPLPGASALISALVVSGLSTERFVFEGFLPRRGQEREGRLAEITVETRTVVIYESPYRIQDTLKDLASRMPERQLALIREISKIHEEKIYGQVGELAEKMQERELQGEIVLVIDGREKDEDQIDFTEMTVLDHLKLLMDRGYTKKQAIKEAARVRELPKSEVYKEAIVIDARVNQDD